ncbi:hypothetical protein LIER_08309 [Lithospermum erythrorhizon]|uniref:Pentatricopeptide repeat-containing protein n=1 Tax=Lithospermum erythrorhizon TaxID=34254 RepID=A0AAV3PBF4_LITER
MFGTLFATKRFNLFIRGLHLGKQLANPSAEHILVSAIRVNIRQKKWKFVDKLFISNSIMARSPSMIARVFQEFRSSPGVLLEIFDRIRASDSSVLLSSLECCSVMIHVLVNSKKYDDAMFLMKELMIAKGYMPLEVLEGLVDSSLDEGVAVFDALVRACTQMGKTEGAYEVMHKLRMENIWVSIHAWNNFLNSLVKSDQLLRFWAVYEEILSHGYFENVNTFNLIIYALCNEFKLDEAISVYYKMIKGGIVPNIVCFNMIIDGACKIGDLGLALKLVRKVETMSRGCITANEVSYNCLINGYCKAGNAVNGEEFLKEMIDRGVQPNERTYATLVDGYSRNGQIEEAFRFCDEMVEKDMVPNSFIYNPIMHWLYSEGDTHEALSVLSDMVKRNIPDQVTHSVIVKGLLRNSMLSEALSYAKPIMETNLVEDAFLHNIIMDYCCKSKDTAKAEQILCSMFVQGLIPDLITYGTLIDGYCKEGKLESAFEAYNDMIRADNYPNIVIYNSIIDGLWKNGSLDAAKYLAVAVKNQLFMIL